MVHDTTPAYPNKDVDAPEHCEPKLHAAIFARHLAQSVRVARDSVEVPTFFAWHHQQPEGFVWGVFVVICTG